MLLPSSDEPAPSLAQKTEALQRNLDAFYEKHAPQNAGNAKNVVAAFIARGGSDEEILKINKALKEVLYTIFHSAPPVSHCRTGHV